ncbi:MAG: ATP-binding protein [bacterium]|nr:ATP-binding protein [bacterium]
MYIARMFVEGHGGKVWATSAGEGQGSEFGLWIPEEKQNL